MSALEQTIAANPTSGAVIPGLKGLRKLRFMLGGKGKRGGGRAIYFLMIAADTAVMVAAFGKSEQEDLSQTQKKAFLAFMKEVSDG
jgi:hypothetical protein